MKTPDTEVTSASEEDYLAIRPKSTTALRVHPLPEGDGLIVSVLPPAGTSRVACDVVLVIDISGSMGAKAPAPDNAKGETEVDGLTVLDLTKQAARAVFEAMDERDRLGIVTFTDDATVVMELTAMTAANKTMAWEKKIKPIRPLGLTNMWHGILLGKGLLDGQARRGSMPAMMVLTDGISNSGNPPQGFVNRLRTYALPAPIHTFGFGYDINSSLLQSVAEVAGGNFAFISDASMLATVFIHAVAHLQSAYASSATLTVSGPLQECTGPYVRKDTTDEPGVLNIPLGTLQLAQSRDILLKGDISNPVQVELRCQPVDGPALHLESWTEGVSSLPHDTMLFHRNRAALCALVTTLAPINRDSERAKDTAGKTLQPLVESIRRLGAEDTANQALLEDLSDQMTLAISKDYIDTWGFHYLLSMYNAHLKQLCTSFKDPGPQQYNQTSTVFQEAKATLSDLFDALPPPKPTVTVRSTDGSTRRVAMSMSRYHRSSNPCFAAGSRVRTEQGAAVAIDTLRAGDRVWTPAGPRRVQALVATRVQHAVLCRIGSLLVTPWHPIRALDDCQSVWAFPAHVAAARHERYIGDVFSVLLEASDGDDDNDDNADAHAIHVEHCLGVTLGHGAAAEDPDDVRHHAFFADHARVAASLRHLPLVRGVLRAAGTRRGPDGRVCGFVPEGEEEEEMEAAEAATAACRGGAAAIEAH